MSEPHEYCLVHDQPLDWCREPDRCCEYMARVTRLIPEMLRRLADD